MFAPVKKNASLKTKINKYLIETYHNGYDLDIYFTNNDQIMMFEKLLDCDINFKEKWTKGLYVTPEDNTSTRFLSPYITKKSISKRLSRKLFKHTYYGKLTEGSKNLLQGYMIEYSQEQTTSIDEKMNKIFCGIFSNIDKREQAVINKAISKSTRHIYESGVEDIIYSYLHKKKNGGNKTRKKWWK